MAGAVLKRNIKYAGTIGACALIFLSLSLYNGYPLVTADSGSYIRYAFDLQLPADRSAFYSIFITVSSIRLSLSFIIAVQAILLSMILLEYANLFIGKQKSIPVLIFMALITLGTPVVWVVSYIMPDIFTGVLLLCCLLFLFENDRRKIFYYTALILIATIIHNSHLLIMLIFSAGMTIVFRIAHEKKLFRKACFIFGISVFSWLLISTIHFVKGFGFTISSGKHIFMMGNLDEKGILRTYLDNNCSHKRWQLCDYKNDLTGNANDFLWSENSPLYKTGGWDSSKSQYTKIITDILTTPAHLFTFVQKSFVFSCRQLAMILPDRNVTPFDIDSPPGRFIKQYLPHELNAFARSKQNAGGMTTGPSNSIYMIFLAASTLGAVFSITRLQEKRTLCYLYVAVVLFIICNAIVVGTFAIIADRLQYRAFWILPATNILVIFNWILNRKGYDIGGYS